MTFSYNNSLYTAMAFLGLFAHGTTPETLEESYAAEVRKRVLEPIGMADAAILDEPRPLGDDYAVGYLATREISSATPHRYRSSAWPVWVRPAPAWQAPPI